MQGGLRDKRGANPFPRLLPGKMGKPCCCGPGGSWPRYARLRRTQPGCAGGGLHPGLSEGLVEVLQRSRSKTKISLSSAEALCGVAHSGFVLNTEDRVANACVQDMWKKALQADLSLKLAFLYILQRGFCTSECGGDKVLIQSCRSVTETCFSASNGRKRRRIWVWGICHRASWQHCLRGNGGVCTLPLYRIFSFP